MIRMFLSDSMKVMYFSGFYVHAEITYSLAGTCIIIKGTIEQSHGLLPPVFYIKSRLYVVSSCYCICSQGEPLSLV